MSKILKQLVEEERQKCQDYAHHLSKGMTTIQQLKEVISNLFRVAIVEEDPSSGEIIIHTGMKEVDLTSKMPNDSEDMRRKGDLRYMGESEDPKFHVRPKLSIGPWL